MKPFVVGRLISEDAYAGAEAKKSTYICSRRAYGSDVRSGTLLT
jgi:hypothetical protein